MNYVPKKVLFLGNGEPNVLTSSNIHKYLEQKKIHFDFVGQNEDTLDVLFANDHDIFMLDFELNGEKTFSILRKLLKSRPKKSVIIIADEKDKHLYTKVMRAGACDFLIRQTIDTQVLEKSIYYSFRHSKILADLRESQSKYKDLVEHLPAMFYIAEIFQPYAQIYASPMFAKFGYEISDWLGVKNMWQSVLHPDDKEWVLAETDKAMDNCEETNYEYRIIGKNGEVFWVHDTGHFYYAADGETIYWQGLMSDITERKLAQEKLIHKMKHDELTKLKNRSCFIEQLEITIEKFEKNSSQRFAVFLLDIDKFKVINDTLGHLTGDQFLIEVSRRLEKIVGESGIVSRLSGDEFAVLIEDANDKRHIESIAKDISRALASTVELNGYKFSSSASIGITISDETQKTTSDVLRNADLAMYYAKSSGKNCYKYHDQHMYADNLRLVNLENELRYAIERNELSLHFQPIISLETGKAEQVEALLRWDNNNFGNISPAEFIPIAEECGLIESIGQWVLEESCKQLKEWQNSFSGKEELVMCINISAKQIVKEYFAESVRETLETLCIDPKNLRLEITETSLMQNEEYVFETIEALHKIGVGLSTDDFGTGFSSLSYLHKFPFEELKIDSSFINNIDTDHKSQKIVSTIIKLAESLDLKVVAEGVETKEQMEELMNLGCDYAQGFYFARPMLAFAIENILQNGINIGSKNKAPLEYFVMNEQRI